MQNWSTKNRSSALKIGTVVLIVLGICLIVVDRLREYTVLVDGKSYTLRTFALTPRQVLKQAGYPPLPGDRIYPQVDHTNLNFTYVKIIRQRPVTIFTPTETHHFESAEILPANLFQFVGIKLFPGDVITQGNVEIDPGLTLMPGQEAVLTYLPAKHISVNLNGSKIMLFTHQPSLELALIEAGITLSENSVSSLPLNSRLEQRTEVSIRTARRIVANSPNGSTSGFTAAFTVGEALRDLSIPLQGMNRSEPSEDQPLPANGSITLTKVEENLAFETIETAYSNTYVEDPNAELDTISTVLPGQTGLVVTRNRTRVENGVKIGDITEGPWKASGPIDGVLGWGTKPIIRTEVVDGETIEYWRKVTVYATGYMPSSQGGHTGTASGIPLTKGIIAVTVPWYRAMKFQKVFVPGYGYGTIADTGGGIPGRYWIDLGFDDTNYVSWHDWTVMYLLTPIPDFIPSVLP